MEETKLNIKALLNSIFKSTGNPIFALDSDNNTFEFNNSAAEILKFEEECCNLSDLLSEVSFKNLDKLIKIVVSNKSILTSEDFLFKLKDGSEIISNITVNYIGFEEDYFVLVSLVAEQVEEALLSFTKIDIRSGNPVESILNPRLKQVLREIKNLYPFTVAGKDRLRKMIDEFNEFIRIKNDLGKFVLVNSAYAQSLGVSVAQLEGRNESDFMPQYIIDFLSSVDNYLYKTHNYIIIEGMPLKGISNAAIEQVIEIPITDYQNNVIAVVGITQNKLSYPDEEVSAELHLSAELIEIFPKPVALVDQYGQFKHASKEFCNFVCREIEILNGVHVTEVLPSEFAELIKDFQNSNSPVKDFHINENLVLCCEEESKFRVFLNKISIPGVSSDGIFIFIDEEKKEVDLNRLIKQRGRMFDILIQNNPEPIFIYDIDTLRFLEANEAALALYGYSREEFLEMDLTDLYTPEDIQTLLGSSAEDSSINKFSGPYRHKQKNGNSVFVEISKTKFQFNGKDSFFNIIRDVTSKLELEKKNQLFKAAFENTDDIIFITDANGFINFINKSGMTLLGYTQNEIQNTSFAALLKDDHRAMINTSVFIPEVRESVTLQLEIKKDDGSFVNSEVVFSPILDFSNQVESFTILMKVAKDRHTEPKEIVKEVIKEVIVEKSEPKDSNLPDPNFLSGVFHEILTPMNVILGFAQELTDSISDPTSEQKEASELINQNKAKLLSTMNSVVEYSELIQQKAKLEYSDLPITELVSNIDKKISELFNSPDTQFSYGKISSSLVFNTDAHKFETLITSLIKVVGRLIKEKKIYLSAFPYDDDRFVILISDNYSNCSEYLTSRLSLIYTGNNDIKDIGAPKLSTYLSRILLPLLGGYFIENDKFGGGFIFPLSLSQKSDFKPVESLDVSIDDFLGSEETETEESIKTDETNLSMDELTSEVKEELVEPSEQQIPEEVVEEQPVQETEDFSFSEVEDETKEPLISEFETEPQEQQVQDAEEVNLMDELTEEAPESDKKEEVKTGTKLDLSNLSCLYIEDQVDSQLLFKVQMKGLKEIKFAVSFEEALPMLESRTFDFIVMDINLQGEYNGLDALKIINKMPAHEKTPIVAVTAYVLPGDKEKFIATGFNDFVSKPIFREKMLESLEKIFSR